MAARIDHRFTRRVRRGLRRLTSNRRKLLPDDSPNSRLIIHACHHRVGTNWFRNILNEISEVYGLRFDMVSQPAVRPDTDIFMQNQSWLNVGQLRPFRGTHIIRDPRDVVISSYFYHLWTREAWALKPLPAYGGVSYQEYIQSLDQDEGLLAEIYRARNIIGCMAQWNYAHPDFLEIRYEELIADEQATFDRVFRHYGFRNDAIPRCLDIVSRYSFKKVTGRTVGTEKSNTHLRSGKAEQWRELFGNRHRRAFKERYGNVLIRLGYEQDLNW